jgi:hypothetical protein
MLHLKSLSDKYQKRTLRVEYGHTQATPYDVTLDPSLRNTDGSVRIPQATDTRCRAFRWCRCRSVHSLGQLPSH